MKEDIEKICSVVKTVVEVACSGAFDEDDILEIVKFIIKDSFKSLNREQIQKYGMIFVGHILVVLSEMFPMLVGFGPMLRMKVKSYLEGFEEPPAVEEKKEIIIFDE